MARRVTAPVAAPSAGAPLPHAVTFNRIDIERVRFALTKARAGWWLLDALNYGHLSIDDTDVPVGRRGAGPYTETERDDVADWLEKFALEKIQESLIEVGNVVGVPFGATPVPARRQRKAVA